MEQLAPFIKGARWTLTVGEAPFINECSNLQLQVGAVLFMKGSNFTVGAQHIQTQTVHFAVNFARRDPKSIGTRFLCCRSLC